jgi:hypothetical protein
MKGRYWIRVSNNLTDYMEHSPSWQVIEVPLSTNSRTPMEFETSLSLHRNPPLPPIQSQAKRFHIPLWDQISIQFSVA